MAAASSSTSRKPRRACPKQASKPLRPPQKQKKKKAPRIRIRNRYICATLNNYTDDEYARIWNEPRCSYLVIGKENSKDDDDPTPHLQIYMEFFAQVDFKQIAEILSHRGHIEQREATAQQAADYCKKEEDYAERGTISSQGERSDMAPAIELLRQGHPIEAIVEQYPFQYVKYHKGFEKLAQFYIPDRTAPPNVTVFWGSTGTGKSFSSRALCPKEPQTFVWSPHMDKWFDGYTGQRYIIMEEFRGQIALPLLLVILDPYNTRVQIKTTSIKFSATEIVITSPIHPKEWYPWADNHEDGQQLLRRLTNVKELRATEETSSSDQC